MRALDTIFLLCLFPAICFAGNVGMAGSSEDCALTRALTADLSGIPKALCEQAIDRYKKGRQTQENVTAICRGTQNVAWYQNRDNSMEPAESDVGGAMGVVMSREGASQAIQVCPGVYLATAHGVLDGPDDGKVVPPSENLYGISTYPLSTKNYSKASSNAQFFSPRIDNPSSWDDYNSDFVFIKLDKKISNTYVKPMRFSPEELIKETQNQSFDVNLYRGNTAYTSVDKDGTPNFETGKQASKFEEFQKIYQEPMKVTERCDLSSSEVEGLFASDCPTENHVSGSPNIARVDGKPYVVGITAFAVDKSLEKPEHMTLPNEMVSSNQFCEYYEKACGASYKCSEFSVSL